MTTLTEAFTPSESEAPVKRRRKPRRGPPGVVCPSCHKIAGAEDEGRIDDYEVSVSGDTDSVTATIDGASLILTSACCGQDFKRYDLSGNDKQQDHVCPKVTERDEAEEKWRAHCESECVAECMPADGDKPAETCCDTGTGLLEAFLEISGEVSSQGSNWEVRGEGGPEAYQRYQTHVVNRRTGKSRPIKNSRYAKSWRGLTVTVEAEHELCGETVDIEFEQGDAEAQSGDFEEV